MLRQEDARPALRTILSFARNAIPIDLVELPLEAGVAFRLLCLGHHLPPSSSAPPSSQPSSPLSFRRASSLPSERGSSPPSHEPFSPSVRALFSVWPFVPAFG